MHLPALLGSRLNSVMLDANTYLGTHRSTSYQRGWHGAVLCSNFQVSTNYKYIVYVAHMSIWLHFVASCTWLRWSFLYVAAAPQRVLIP